MWLPILDHRLLIIREIYNLNIIFFHFSVVIFVIHKRCIVRSNSKTQIIETNLTSQRRNVEWFPNVSTLKKILSSPYSCHIVVHVMTLQDYLFSFLYTYAININTNICWKFLTFVHSCSREYSCSMERLYMLFKKIKTYCKVFF